MGTPEFAAVSLQALLRTGYDLVGVVTQPDRPQGRGLELQASEVKKVALEQHLPLWQPEKVNTTEFITLFRQLNPDVVVVVAFGQKIPMPILYEPKFGCINVHGSLLPRYRGAAPIQWTLINGDTTAGVTTMYMDEGWDTGDLIYQATTAVDPDENFACLYQRLARLGGELLVKTLADVEHGVAPRLAQNSAEATTAPKLKPELHRINWNEPAVRIHNLVRALAPTPGAETFWGTERLKVIKTSLYDCIPANADVPGKILQVIKRQGILVATGTQPLLLVQVQPAGKKLMAATDYANGRHLVPGMIFGTRA